MREDFPKFLGFLEKELGGRIEVTYSEREQITLNPNEFYVSRVIHQKPDGDRYKLGTLTIVYDAEGVLIRKGYHGKIPDVKKESVTLSFDSPWHLIFNAFLVHETEKPWERHDDFPDIPFP